MSVTPHQDMDLGQRLSNFVQRVRSQPFYSYFDVIVAPTEKLIASQKLTYLPNLYFRQYKLIENLNQLRIDFPEHKILVPRQKTGYDQFLLEIKQNQFIFNEERKYRKAKSYQIAKSIKKQVFKTYIKKEEKHLFQRVVYSQLAEAVREKFQTAEHKNVKIEEQMIPQKKKIQIPHQDQIFIERNNSESQYDQQQNDLFFDILNQKKVSIREEVALEENIQTIEPVSKHIEEVASHNSFSRGYRYKTVNRKQFLKKINENLRKRIKSKGNNQDSLERNLNSATVAITTIINLEPQLKNTEDYLQAPHSLQYLQITEVKTKKKKDESFDLRWAEEDLEKFHQINGKVDMSKQKFDPNYLLLQLENNQTEYEKYFEKNIKGKKNFPPDLKQLPSLESKFEKKYFYNELTDRQYEDFMMRYNKKNLLNKFQKIAPFVLSDSYCHDYDGSKNINVAKMFLSQDALQSDRLIYKINNRKLIPLNSIQQKLILSEEELLQLSFLVRKYLSQFGNNWKLICLFVSIHPTFSHMNLTMEQIQEFHQIARRKFQTNSEMLQVYSSRVLPFQVYNSSSYEQYQANSQYEMMDEEYPEKVDHFQETRDFDFSSYEKILNEPLQQEDEPSPYGFQKTQQSFKNFVESTKKMQISQNKFNLMDNLNKVLDQFQPRGEQKKASFQKPGIKPYFYEQVSTMNQDKSQIKGIFATRKRKLINEKTSELVKILQILKTKYSGGHGGQNVSRAPTASQQKAPPTQTVAKVNPPTTSIHQSSNMTASKDQSKPKPAANQKSEKPTQNSEKKTPNKGGNTGRRKRKDHDDK